MPDKPTTDKPTAPPAPAGQPDRPPFIPTPYQAHLAAAAKDAGLEGPDAHKAIVAAERVNALRLAESHVAQAVQVAGYDHDQAVGVLMALEERIADARAAKSPLAEAAIVGMAREAYDGLGVNVPQWVEGEKRERPAVKSPAKTEG